MGARVAITCCAIIVVWLWTTSAAAAGSPAALVDGMMDFYDMRASERLTENERVWIRWGAEHEGLQLRQLQHSRVATRDSAIPNAIPVVSARQWIHDTSVQSNVAFQGNYTWGQAIADAKSGDRQRGYEALGHILRVLEDVSIPQMGATFNTSPYWRWMHAQSAETIEALTRSMRRTGGWPERLASIDAAYDTILSSVVFLFGESVPENGLPTTADDLRIETSGGIRRVYAVARGDDGQSVRVARWKGFHNEWTMADPAVLEDTWQYLAPVTIRNGASVIQLYQNEVDAARTVVATKKERRWWHTMYESVDRVAHRVFANASRDIRSATRVLARVVELVPSFSPQGVSARPELLTVAAAPDTAKESVVIRRSIPTPAPTPLPLALSVPVPLPLAESVPIPVIHHPEMDIPSPDDVQAEEVVIRTDASVENVVEEPAFEVPTSSITAAPPVDIQGFPIGYMPSPRPAPVVVSELPAPQPEAPEQPQAPQPEPPPAEPEAPPVPEPVPPPAPEPEAEPQPEPVGSSDPTAPSDDGAEPPPAPPAEEPPPAEPPVSPPPPPPPPPPPTPSPAVIEIVQVNFQGGAAAENIVLSNTGGQDQDMANWTLSDDAATPHTYTFGAATLAAGASVVVHTGKGTDTATDVYWNRGSGVWNDGGDTATLKNDEGTVVDSETW